MSGPLDDVKILDLSQVQAGPSCTQLMAWLGADVIKIEEPGIGDRTRRERAIRPNVDSFYFLVFNANKRSLCLDLKSDAGREIFLRLVGLTDIVVENFRPGQMERFNLGYQVLKEANPKIVYATIKGFGSNGPNAHIRTFEHIAQAMGGAMSVNGEADGNPQFVAPGVGDSGSGLHAVIGMLAALRQRDRTGQCQRVEVSMQDAVVNLMRIHAINTLNTDKPVERQGNRPWGAQSMIYPCKGGGPNDFVVMMLAGDSWDTLLALAGRAELIGDPRYATEQARAERQFEVEGIITAWTRTRTKQEAMRILAEVGIPAGAVQDTREILEDPHLVEREMIVNIHDPERGEYKIIGCPIKIDTNRVVIEPPPLLGQHSDEVLSTMLGMPEDKLADLHTDKII